MEQVLNQINDPKIATIMMITFIIGDIATGYLKAWKLNKLNSSISRDGFIKKMGWFVALVLGLAINFFLGLNHLVILVATMCCATECLSLFENLAQIGVNLKSFTGKLQQLNDENGGK